MFENGKNIMKIYKNSKYLSLLLAISILISTTFTSCMTKDDKKISEKNLKIAKPIIENFIDEHYNGATVENIKCVTFKNESLTPYHHPTDYVSADISYKGNNFILLVNSQTKKCFTDYYKAELIDAIKEKIISDTEIKQPFSFEIFFTTKDISLNLQHTGETYSDNCFAEYGIVDADTLFESNDYYINAILNYVDEKPDLNKLNIEKLLKNGGSNDFELSFVNYYDLSRYDNQMLFSDYINSSNLTESISMRNLDNIRLVTSGYKYVDGEKIINNTDYEDKFFEISHKIVDGIEFVWNSSSYNIDFSEKTAQITVDPGFYDNAIYTSTSSNVVNLEIKDIDNEESASIGNLYTYFNKSKRGKYLLVFEDDKCISAKSINEDTTKYCYNQWSVDIEATKDNPQNVSVGVYKKIKQEDISSTQAET